jgi:hypothetical protein
VAIPIATATHDAASAVPAPPVVVASTADAARPLTVPPDTGTVAVRPDAAPAEPASDAIGRSVAALDAAVEKQRWLAPRGQSVYDLLRRLERDAPADPRVVEARRRVVAALEQKGQSAMEGGRFGEAEIAYRSLARISPGAARVQALAAALAGQADALARAGKREVALRQARAALSLDADQPVAKKLLTRLGVGVGRRVTKRKL